MSSIVKNDTKTAEYISYADWLIKTGFSSDQLRILFRTTNVFQLTTGCSNYCRRCNEWALPGVRAHFSFDAVKSFTKALFNTGNREFIFYGASDPLDWEDGDADLKDIESYLRDNCYLPEYGFLTKMPLKKHNTLSKLINQNADIAVSVTKQNRDRIKSFENDNNIKLNKQHDFDDLLIPAGLDEDFCSVKPSITDSYGSEITPNGAFLVIPAFTSVLNLTGQHRITADKETLFFLERKTGRNALPVEYFKPLAAVDNNGNKFRLNNLFSVQVENIILDSGDENLTPPGMMCLEEFFTTFEKNAVLKRKKIIPSIIKEYKNKHLDKASYKKSSLNSRKQFRERLNSYLMLCSTKKMRDVKKSTLSYFLKDISVYLINNPEKAVIIMHLKEKEQKELYSNFAPLFSDDRIENMIEANNPTTFIIFKILILRLLRNHNDFAIHNFIRSFKSYYDPQTDMFLKSRS